MMIDVLTASADWRGTHISLQCYNSTRTALCNEDIASFLDWMMEGGKTDEELAYWLHKYLLLRGESTMIGFGDLSP